MSEKLEILYEDEELIVCRKPAGIPVQSAKVGQKDMASILNVYFTEAQADRKIQPDGANRKQEERKNHPSVYIVHRLDQPVEGVLVFAKTKRAAAGLSRQVADGSMKKIYQAVCCVHAGKACTEDWQEAGRSGGRAVEEGQEKTDYGGNCFKPGEEYCLVDYLVKDSRTNSSSVAKPGSRNAKRAELSFRVLGRKEPMSGCAGREGNSCFLAEIELKTGRHHQIRVQMAHAGLPLYGDRKYNRSWQEYLTEPDRLLLAGGNSGKIPLALCAVSLTFRHPVSKKPMKFEVTPLSAAFSLFRDGES